MAIVVEEDYKRRKKNKVCISTYLLLSLFEGIRKFSVHYFLRFLLCSFILCKFLLKHAYHLNKGICIPELAAVSELGYITLG
jgi:hypothetical protein